MAKKRNQIIYQTNFWKWDISCIEFDLEAVIVKEAYDQKLELNNRR